MWKEEQKNHAGTKLSREQKLDLYAQLKQTLLNRALPSVEYVDALWEVDNRMLYLFSTSKAQIDEFTGLFQRTFYQLVGSKKNDALLKMASPLYSGAERLIKGNSELASSFFSQLSSIVPETWVSEDNNF